MERTKHLFAVLCGLILLGAVTNASAQPDLAGQAYRAYVSSDLAQWTDVLDRMEQAPGPATEAGQLELLNHYYGHIGFLLGNGAKADARKYLKKAMASVDALLDRNPAQPAALAYKGIYTAYRMSLSKISAPILGPKTMKYIKRAYRNDPGSVEAVTAMGNLLYHAPTAFGGDKPAGIAYIEQAVALLESEQRTTKNWNYLNLLVMLAEYRQQTGDRQEALAVYEKILRFEPDFIRVRDQLYPTLQNALAGP